MNIRGLWRLRKASDRLRRAARRLDIKELARRMKWRHPAEMDIVRVASQEEFLLYRERTRSLRARQAEKEAALAVASPTFQTTGFCFVCGRWTGFLSSWDYSFEEEGRRQVNWREHLRCRHCGLNNRMRASVHILTRIGVNPERSHVYITECVTPLFAALRKRYPFIVGSEYLGNTAPLGECNASGVMNQDLTRLTFPDNRFDLILCLDVLEHIPDYKQAMAECRRILSVGGLLLFSVPFDAMSKDNRIRARRRPDGSVENLLPPEYHGNPVSADGTLCFQYFGWEILDEVRRAGFRSAVALCYHSLDYAYLGRDQVQFLAQK